MKQTHPSSKSSVAGGAAPALARGIMPLLAICAVLAVAVALARPARAGDYQSLSQLIARWRAYVEQFRDLPSEERVPRSKEFFHDIPWDNVEYLCFEGSAGVGPDSAKLTQYIMRYRLEVAPPPVGVLAAFFGDPRYIVPCKEPILTWAITGRDSLEPAARRRFAGIFLDATRLPDLPRPFSDRLYTGAAALSPGDTLMGIMMDDVRSPDTLRVQLGFRMLAASCDPRAPDSLAGCLERFHAERSPLYDLAMDHCRGACAERAFDVLRSSYRNPWSERQRVRAITGLAQVPRPETARVLLDAYGDGGAIADSTFTTAGAARARYYELWLATRIAETYLLQWLKDGPDEAAGLALELLDRALRFGPMDDDAGVVAGLEALAVRAPAGLRPRVLAVRERALAPPQTRHR